MKRIIQRYLFLIMGMAIAALLMLNYALVGVQLRRELTSKFQYALDQIEQTLQENHLELKEVETDLYNEYITKTTALAYILHDRPSVLNNQKELEQMRQLLDVDEVCITDDKGVIRYSSDLSYIGLDFTAHEQTRFFLPILEDPSLKLVQGIEKNASHNEDFQYAGVSTIGQPGIVQIGMKPIRLLKAQERCTYPYLFSRMPVGPGENIFAIDRKTHEILAHSQDPSAGTEPYAFPSAGQSFESYTDGGFLQMDGKKRYVVSRLIDDVIVAMSVPEEILYESRPGQMAATALYLAISGLMVIFALNHLLSEKIVDCIGRINHSLSEIEKGNLSLTINENGTPEFRALSSGINQMVRSLVGVSGKISRIINTTGVNFAAFEFDRMTNHLMLTDRLQSILGLNDEEYGRLRQSGTAFLAFLDEVMTHPMEGEQNIYLIDQETEHWARIVLSSDEKSVAGTITDISEDMKKRLHIQFERDHDALTGLSNYRYFQERMSGLLVSEAHTGFAASVMIDLDKFKSINDTWGHDFGDTYLQRMAKVLRTLERSGTITARRAGDEFCIFFYGWPSKDAIRQEMQRLGTLLKQHQLVFPDGQKRMIRASFGLAWAEPKEISFENLMHNADNALYHAKKEDSCHYVEFEKRFSCPELPE